MTFNETSLLTEANRLNYRLRSTFFYRKLKEYKTLSFRQRIERLLPVKDLYSWDGWINWGIGEDAFSYIDGHSNLQLIQVFCHPRLIREYPILLAYYRNIAALSQKAVKYLVAIDVKRVEADEENRYPLTEDKALALSGFFNEHISLIIDSSLESLSEEQVHTRIQTDSTISFYFNLTEILSEDSTQYEQFTQAVFSLLEE